MSTQISSQATQAAIAACEKDHPGIDISRDAKLIAEEPGRLIVAVYMPLPNLQPSPYAVYAVDRATLAARRLKATEGRLYRLKNDG